MADLGNQPIREKINSPIVDSMLRVLLCGHAFSDTCLNGRRRRPVGHITAFYDPALAPQTSAPSLRARGRQ
jgi:hypothetical protein